jgi:hypothetical protein
MKYIVKAARRRENNNPVRSYNEGGRCAGLRQFKDPIEAKNTIDAIKKVDKELTAYRRGRLFDWPNGLIVDSVNSPPADPPEAEFRVFPIIKGV